jgi:hypothetical protein
MGWKQQAGCVFASNGAAGRVMFDLGRRCFAFCFFWKFFGGGRKMKMT